MPKFEVIPGNPKLQALYEMGQLARKTEFEVSLIETTDTMIRFQLLSENDGTAQGKSEHYNFLNLLLENSDVISDKNTEITVKGEVVNIIITFS